MEYEVGFSYNYTYEVNGEADFNYVVRDFDALTISTEVSGTYRISDRVFPLHHEAFWLAGTTYADSTKSSAQSTDIDTDNLILSDVKTYWESTPIDFTPYSIENLVSLVDTSYVPANASVNLYIGTGATKIAAQSATLTYVPNNESLITLGVSGTVWVVIGIEYVPGGP